MAQPLLHIFKRTADPFIYLLLLLGFILGTYNLHQNDKITAKAVAVAQTAAHDTAILKLRNCIEDKYLARLAVAEKNNVAYFTFSKLRQRIYAQRTSDIKHSVCK